MVDKKKGIRRIGNLMMLLLVSLGLFMAGRIKVHAATYDLTQSGAVSEGQIFEINDLLVGGREPVNGYYIYYQWGNAGAL